MCNWDINVNRLKIVAAEQVTIISGIWCDSCPPRNGTTPYLLRAHTLWRLHAPQRQAARLDLANTLVLYEVLQLSRVDHSSECSRLLDAKSRLKFTYKEFVAFWTQLQACWYLVRKVHSEVHYRQLIRFVCKRLAAKDKVDPGVSLQLTSVLSLLIWMFVNVCRSRKCFAASSLAVMTVECTTSTCREIHINEDRCTQQETKCPEWPGWKQNGFGISSLQQPYL